MSLSLALLLSSTPVADAAPKPAREETEHGDKQLDLCIYNSKGTNVEFSICYRDALQRADDKLNAIWKVALADVGGRTSEGGKALVAEQRAWITFKEKSCDFYWAKDFGSLHRSIIGPSCRLDVVNARIKQLEDITDFFTAYRRDDA